LSYRGVSAAKFSRWRSAAEARRALRLLLGGLSLCAIDLCSLRCQLSGNQFAFIGRR